jgi:type I restriction enzyme S subunit
MGDEGLPFARAGNINNGFHFEEADILSNESVDKAKAAGKLSRPGDVTFTSKGTFGRFAFVSERTRRFVYSPQLCYWRVKDHRLIDHRFLYYWMQGPDSMNQLVQVKGLTDMADYVSLTNQRRMWLSAPPLSTQRKIAAILSAYDDLIENNQRRIKILEQMAQNLYREWFVKFRFPGHEHARFTNSALGRIPEGWNVVKLADVADVNRAQINVRSAPDEIHYIDISSVSPGQIDSITTYAFTEAPGRARRVVQHGDVLWSCVRPNRCSHARVMHPEPNTIASTGFAVLTATKVPFTFLYFSTTTDDFVSYLTNSATGAAYPAVTTATFENADVIVSPMPLLMKFGDTTIPMAEQIHTLQRRNQTLRRTRDLLLPRLISGEVDVSGLDIAAPEEAA